MFAYWLARCLSSAKGMMKVDGDTGVAIQTMGKVA